MLLGFKLNHGAFPGAFCLLERDDLPAAGGIEQGFFQAASGLKEFNKESFCVALSELISDEAAEWILISRNSKTVFDENILTRLTALGERIEPFRDRIALISGGGLDCRDARTCAFYSSAEPFLFYNPMLTPIVDTMLELYMVAAADARNVLAEAGPIDNAFELAVIAQGYAQHGKVSVYAPELAIGVNGPFRARDLQLMAEEFARCLKPFTVDASLPTLAGPLRLTTHKARVDTLGRPVPALFRTMSKAIDEALKPLIHAPTISVVTRTQFRRPYLLRRMLTSISRARVDHFPVEVVLSTDIAGNAAAGYVEDLQAEFPNLELRLAVNDNRDEHSRVANLFGGVNAAQGEYIWFMDDDDYVDMFSFERIGRVFIGNARPIITGDSEVHEEIWDLKNKKFPVLSSSTLKLEYRGRNWRSMFTGVNHWPICAPIIPRDFLLHRIRNFKIKFDLSEDYTLFLLLLTAPNLPPIIDLNQTIAHISHRSKDDNSVTAVDRTQWTRDIAGNLHNLLYSPETAEIGCWAAMMTHKPDPIPVDFRSQIEKLQDGLDRKDRQIAELMRYVKYLRGLCAETVAE